MTISVCMASYNGEKFIKEQIESIVSQLSKEDELIISDDSSTDNTINIIKSFKDSRIIILENCKFKSPLRNFENAIKHAKNDYIFLADQDDVWLPNKVEIMLEYLKKYDLVVSDFKVADKELNIIKDGVLQDCGVNRNIFSDLIKVHCSGCCMAFSRKILDFAFPFPNVIMHDLWLFFISKVFGRVCQIQDKLILYRRHNDNCSFTAEKSKNGIVFKLKWRFMLAIHIVLRYIKIINLRRS